MVAALCVACLARAQMPHKLDSQVGLNRTYVSGGCQYLMATIGYCISVSLDVYEQCMRWEGQELGDVYVAGMHDEPEAEAAML